MGVKQIGRSVGRLTFHLIWPWPAMRRSIRELQGQKQQHEENIRYIKELARGGNISTSAETSSLKSFAEVMANRPAGAPSIAALERRFLRQKRLAIGTGLAFIAIGGYAIIKGNLLGIATLLSCLPIFFMASLSAQLRLWQLRMRRLSKDERGGIRDFIVEIDGWYWQVVDPEIGFKQEDES